MPNINAGDEIDELVPDPQAAKELNISLMTVWRWDRDPQLAALGWPPPVYIRKRKYRGRKLLENFKSSALRRAIGGRSSYAQDSKAW
jgi:hypothetical protein